MAEPLHDRARADAVPVAPGSADPAPPEPAPRTAQFDPASFDPASSGTGQPESGRPESGRPESRQPESGRSESRQPESRQPESGQPESGQPESGQSEPERSESRQLESGRSESRQPESEQPDASRPEASRPDPGLASAPPRRTAGTRSRAGNAMARTRAGLLEGALRAVARQGTRRTTMNDIAASAGVAKATLYNHFRAKDDVWSALVEAELTGLAAECAGLPLTEALVRAATRISQHAAVRRIAQSEPAVLSALLVEDPGGHGWRLARDAVRGQLAAAGVGGEDVVLRWLASHLATPAGPDAIRAAAECLTRGLPSGADAT